MRPRRQHRRPIFVELIGAPGSGKSTLLPTVIEAADAHGLRALTAVQAAREFASRTVIGRVMLRLVRPSRRRAVLWAVFYILSTVSTAAFMLRRPRLVRHLLLTQAGRPRAAGARTRRVVFWYLRLMGSYRFFRSHGRGELIVLDEGFLHRAVQLHASEVEVPAADVIDAYVGCIPRPDLVVHLEAHVWVCAQRVVDRGVWSRFDGERPEEVTSFVGSAHRAVELAAGAARARGWTLVEIDNDGRSLDASRTDLLAQLGCALARLPGQEPGGSSTAPRELSEGPLYSTSVPKPGRVKELLAARLAPPSVGPETAERVLSHYGLRATGEPQNLPLGWRNRNVTVSTTAGKKVLKQYPDRWTDSAILHEHSILEHLAAVCFPAARLEVTPGGDTMVSLDDGRFALFDFAPGVNLAGCALSRAAHERLVHGAGRLLAELHLALDGFLPEGTHHLGRHDADAGSAQGCLDALAELMALPDEVASGDPRWRWLTDHGPRIGSRIAHLEAYLDGASLRTSVIHGDFGLHNLTFEKDGNATVHDFELARVDWHLIDFVIALSRLEPGARRTFLGGYGEIRPVAREERRLLPIVWELYRLCGAVRSWSNFLHHGDERRLATAQARVIEAERIAREGVEAWL